MILWLWGPQMDLNWPFPDFMDLKERKNTTFNWQKEVEMAFRFTVHNAILHIWHNHFLVWFSHLHCLVGGWYKCTMYIIESFGSVRATITICHQAKNNMVVCLAGSSALPLLYFALIFHFIHKSPSKPLNYCIKAWKNQVYHIVQGNLSSSTTVISPPPFLTNENRVLLTYFNFVLHVNPWEVLTIGIPVPHTEWFICRLRESSSQNPVTSWRVTIGTWHSSLIA